MEAHSVRCFAVRVSFDDVGGIHRVSRAVYGHMCPMERYVADVYAERIIGDVQFLRCATCRDVVLSHALPYWVAEVVSVHNFTRVSTWNAPDLYWYWSIVAAVATA